MEIGARSARTPRKVVDDPPLNPLNLSLRPPGPSAPWPLSPGQGVLQPLQLSGAAGPMEDGTTSR